MKLTVNFCITIINETKKKVREIDSKLKSTLPDPEYKTAHKQTTPNEEQVMHQLRRKKVKNMEGLSMVKKTQKIKMFTYTDTR